MSIKSIVKVIMTITTLQDFFNEISIIWNVQLKQTTFMILIKHFIILGKNMIVFSIIYSTTD